MDERVPTPRRRPLDARAGRAAAQVPGLRRAHRAQLVAPLYEPAGLYYVATIVSFDDQLAILVIAGDEDRATSGRRRRPLSAAMKGTRDVIVDLTELTFADSSLMIDLACLAQRLRAQGRMLWLSGAQPNVRTLIEAVGLHGSKEMVIQQGMGWFEKGRVKPFRLHLDRSCLTSKPACIARRRSNWNPLASLMYSSSVSSSGSNRFGTS